jgi:hypothetical protein
MLRGPHPHQFSRDEVLAVSEEALLVRLEVAGNALPDSVPEGRSGASVSSEAADLS